MDSCVTYTYGFGGFVCGEDYLSNGWSCTNDPTLGCTSSITEQGAGPPIACN